MTIKSPPMRAAITFLTPRQVEHLQRPIREVYLQAFAAPPYQRDPAVADSFLQSLLRHHLERQGFRFAAAIDEESQAIVGFAYGHTSQPGQWWHDLVNLSLGVSRSAYWLESGFELVEFAVAPKAQGCGLGSRLHDTVLSGLPHRTALLSTLKTETVALHLYRKRGWQVLLDDFLFPGGRKAYLIMGLELEARQKPAGR